MTRQVQLLPGTLDLLILKALSLGPLHGYGILLRIEQISCRALSSNRGPSIPVCFVSCARDSLKRAGAYPRTIARQIL